MWAKISLCGSLLVFCSQVSAAAVTVSPSNQTIKENATLQLKASVASTWTVSCGSISSAGLYHAGLYPATCTITAKAKSGGLTGSTKVTVVSPVTMSPVSANTQQGKTQQFTASAKVTWTAGCGSISAGGLYTASGTVGSYCTIKGTAVTSPQYHVYGYDHIVASTATGPFTMSPTGATLSEGASQQFTSSASATWTASCGSISSSGLYVAPLVGAACSVTATPTAGGTSASAAVTVTSPIAITPPTATTPQNSTQQFNANLPVTWASTCGSISSSGLFTASGPVAVCTLTATASTGTPYTATASDSIITKGVFGITPANPALTEGQEQQFSAGAAATWSASCGSITSSGDYFAPLTEGSCTIVATATDGSGATVSTAAAVTSPITLTPTSVNLHALNTQSFSASQPVSWTSSCGSISGAGLFTAPALSGSCTLTATASSGTPYTTQATAKVDVVNYTAWKGGGGNTGDQTDELVLTPSNVNSSSFGISWTANVDGWVYAQPLYMNGIVVNGSTHNVVFIATANDSVYAFDGDTGSQLWQTSLIPDNATAVSATTVGFTSAPQIGILSTPVIDPFSHTLFVVSETSEQNATYFPHRLHALDIFTGEEKLGGPVLVSDQHMAPITKLQRPGLLLANGNVYIGIGSLQDTTPYNGLLFAFDAHSLEQQAVWVVTPSGVEGGLWMAGSAPSVDSTGNIYVATGNGTFDGTTNFGEAAVKLSPQLQVLDYFAPYNFATYNSANVDLGSGNVMIARDQNGSFPHELIVCGKPSPIYVLNGDNLGGVGATSDNIIQRLDNAVGQLGPKTSTVYACYSSPAMWKQNVYFVGKYDVLKMFTLDSSTGKLSSSPASQDSLAYGYPGSEPVVSANGTSSGIVWTIDTGTGALRANDASDVSNFLYSGVLTGGVVRWTVPTVVNGHVYAAGKGTVFGFSLH
jgi:PQQ-like domain